ncbi:MAG TPA: serine hydrolase domain-containing protein [Rhizomicrobium sp.]|jgi:D-alanyl-D-alanine carboxypeptidase|nr:serine hydrolase domain-containing protein [Rhizomicrobium sp.]
MAKSRRAWLLAALALLASPAAADPALTAKFDAYLQPTLDAGRFSGAILVTQAGAVVFDKAYGMADRERGIANRTSTSFHIGTLSMQYTAAAVMLLVETHRLSLDNTVAQLVPGVAYGDRITIRDLLGGSLDVPTVPQSYALLARIVEADTGKPLADVLDADFLGPLFLTGSGLDDGTLGDESRMAHGYAPDGADGLKPAEPVQWAARTGEGSAYTTTRDELRWIEAFFAGHIVSAASRQAMLDGSKAPGGYGWTAYPGLGEPAYGAAGTAPGFAAFAVHLPASDVTVVVLGNSESASVVRRLGKDLALLAAGRPLPPPTAD